MENKTTLSDFFELLSEATPDSEGPVEETKITFEDFFKEAALSKIQVDEVVATPDVNYTLMEQSLGLFGGDPTIKTKDPLTPLYSDFVTHQDLQNHYKTFITRVQQQLSTVGGGGETHFLQLDDFNKRSTNDNWVLEYDASSGQVQFTDKIGPIDHIRFDTSHGNHDQHVVGTLSWDNTDQTLNLEHPGGVTQQIGQETYAKVRNGTAETILNGTVVQFAGADENGGTARLLVAPMLADGTYPSLYVLGIATQDIGPGEDGRITVWGKIRDVDTSAFDIGNILYVSPDTPGGLTNIKPTAPNNVIPVAAVLMKDSAGGELFVRPTVEQEMYYGRFTRLTDQTATNVNQGYAVQFDTTEISNGITFNGGNDTQIKVEASGFYQFDLSAQISATSNKGVVYFWFRKNGVDIEHSSRSNTVTNGDTFNVSTTIALSLDANDYIEIMWARTASGIILDARSATSFAPSTASVMLNVAQIQL